MSSFTHWHKNKDLIGRLVVRNTNWWERRHCKPLRGVDTSIVPVSKIHSHTKWLVEFELITDLWRLLDFKTALSTVDMIKCGRALPLKSDQVNETFVSTFWPDAHCQHNFVELAPKEWLLLSQILTSPIRSGKWYLQNKCWRQQFPFDWRHASFTAIFRVLLVCPYKLCLGSLPHNMLVFVPNLIA